jgi:hypothetical protein
MGRQLLKNGTMPIFFKLKKKNKFEETYLTRAGYKIIIFYIAVTIQYETLSKHNIELGFKNQIRYWDLENANFYINLRKLLSNNNQLEVSLHEFHRYN